MKYFTIHFVNGTFERIKATHYRSGNGLLTFYDHSDKQAGLKILCSYSLHTVLKVLHE